jgi:hypothetical protein
MSFALWLIGYLILTAGLAYGAFFWDSASPLER